MGINCGMFKVNKDFVLHMFLLSVASCMHKGLTALVFFKYQEKDGQTDLLSAVCYKLKQ